MKHLQHIICLKRTILSKDNKSTLTQQITITLILPANDIFGLSDIVKTFLYLPNSVYMEPSCLWIVYIFIGQKRPQRTNDRQCCFF